VDAARAARKRGRTFRAVRLQRRVHRSKSRARGRKR
jgi:hypothetical protein